MTKRELERLFMLQSVFGYTTTPANQLIIVQVPAFESGTEALQTIINQITAAAGQQSLPVKGGGAEKDYYRNQLNQVTFAIINACKGYALSVNDAVLAELFSPALSTIAKYSDKIIASKATAWNNIVIGLLPSLIDWGITSTSTEALTEAIVNYVNVYQLPLDKKNAHKLLTQQVAELIDQGVALCKSTLDTSVNSFIELGYQDFVDMYHIYRKIQNVATSPITPALRIYVKNNLEMAITEGEVIVIGTDKSALLDNNGHAFIENIPTGPQMITVTTPYAPATNYGPIDFVDKHIVKLNIVINSPTGDKQTVTVSSEKLVEVASDYIATDEAEE